MKKYNQHDYPVVHRFNDNKKTVIVSKMTREYLLTKLLIKEIPQPVQPGKEVVQL